MKGGETHSEGCFDSSCFLRVTRRSAQQRDRFRWSAQQRGRFRWGQSRAVLAAARAARQFHELHARAALPSPIIKSQKKIESRVLPSPFPHPPPPAIATNSVSRAVDLGPGLNDEFRRFPKGLLHVSDALTDVLGSMLDKMSALLECRNASCTNNPPHSLPLTRLCNVYLRRRLQGTEVET